MNENQHIKGGKEKLCPGCGTRFLCLHNADCWCMDYSLTGETLAFLRRTYDDCLCPPCLSKHGLPKQDATEAHSRN